MPFRSQPHSPHVPAFQHPAASPYQFPGEGEPKSHSYSEVGIFYLEASSLEDRAPKHTSTAPGGGEVTGE